MNPIISKQELNQRRKMKQKETKIDISNIKKQTFKKQEKKEETKQDQSVELTILKSFVYPNENSTESKQNEEKKPKKKFTHQDLKNDLKLIQHQHSQMILNSNIILSHHKKQWKDELSLLDLTYSTDLNDFHDEKNSDIK